MNLSAYDKVPDYINKKTTWTEISSKKLISAEIQYRKYYCIGKKYDVNSKCNKYYLILLDNPPLDRKFYNTVLKNCRLYFKLKDIWDECSLSHIVTDSNINITKVDSDSDGDIYYLDV